MSENEQQKKPVETTTIAPKLGWQLGSAEPITDKDFAALAAAPTTAAAKEMLTKGRRIAHAGSLPTPAQYDIAKMHKDAGVGATGEYVFKGYSNFAVFCRINRDKLFLDGDSATIDGIKNQVDLFLTTQKNTIGGCGCSKEKRRGAALKVYIGTVNMLLKNEEVQSRIVALLNSPPAVIFLKGEKTGASSREPQQPIAVIKV